MKVILVTQTLDPEHGSLAQSLDLVRALAARVDELVVLCRDTRWDQVPENVTVCTFDAATKAGRALAFQRALAASSGSADAVVVHMVPTFLVLAAPLARARKLPLLLWYTHWHASRSLRLATRLCDVALSVDVSSFPLISAKVRGIGHAIDVGEFTCEPPVSHDGPLRLLALGRTARWKGLQTLIEAFRATELDATLELRGPSLTSDELLHREELTAAAKGDARISIEEPLPRAEVPALLCHADVLVSPAEPTEGATLDKAVYEAAACGRPVVTTNAALAPFLAGLPLELLAAPRDAASLAHVLSAVVQATVDERAAVGAALRQRVVEQHSLDHWADTVISIIREVRSPRGG